MGDFNDRWPTDRLKIIVRDEFKHGLNVLSLLSRSVDAKARYKAPHAPGPDYTRDGRRIRDWENRR
jgi:hypothetical protein